MFSYFSSSNTDDAIDINNSHETGVTEAGTHAVGSSNSPDNESSHIKPLSPKKPGVNEAAVVGDDSSAIRSHLPATATSWKQAHDLYCTQHRTLKASIQEILSETCEENQEIPWRLPRRSDMYVLVGTKEVANYLLTKRGEKSIVATTTPLKPSPSSWLMSPLKMVSAVASVLKNPDDEVDEWIQDDDDAFIDDDDYNGGSSSSSSSASLELNTPIINSHLTELAIHSLENEIACLPPDEASVMALSEWDDWAGLSLAKNNTNHVSFSVHDKNFLLHVLVDLKMAKIIRRESHNSLDVVILSSRAFKTDDNEAIPENLRVTLALWDIKKAEEKIEQKLQELSEQAAEYTKNALKYKQRNQMNLAKTQLAKRRLIQKRMDSDSMIQIKLLQTKNAIESAQSNRSTIDLMADSAKLLRQLREETSLEDVDEAMDDLQDEIDGLEDINNTLASLGRNVENMGTEDELLEELQRLVIEDDDAVPAPVADVPTFKTPEQKTIPEKNENKKVSEEVELDSSRKTQIEPEYA